MREFIPLIVAVGYAVALFGFAGWAERRRERFSQPRFRRPAYTLALAVYCTSWTFFGAVGSAASEGWAYLPIYLGPILVYGLGAGFLVRLVDAVKRDGASSISDFIGGRFGKSRGVAALVTALALLGTIPYIALQLRSVGTTFADISGTGHARAAMALTAATLALFAMLFGTRRYEASGRNEAVLFAIAAESLVKLLALLIAAGFATLLLINAPEPQLAQGVARFTANFAPQHIGLDFFVITLLAMSAIICLPRQFYIGVIEARSSDDVIASRWPFIVYLLITLTVVVPITLAGLTWLPAGSLPDLFVLELPLASGAQLVALIVFLGGFSAATAMVVVETIALSTMVSNDLIAPLLLRSSDFSSDRNLGRALLVVRRVAILLVMGAALGWALALPENARLAAIGLIAFAAMAQFAPVLVLAVFGSNRDASAAKASLATGLVLWFYTLIFPQLAPASWLAMLRGSLIDPGALLGSTGLSPISHGSLWSLGCNLAVFAIVSARRVQPRSFPNLLRLSPASIGAVSDMGGLHAMVARFVGEEAARAAFALTDPFAPIDRKNARHAERLIAGVVGVPSARALIGSALSGSRLTHDDVARLLDETGQSLQFSKGLLAATLENIDPGVSVIDRDLNLIAWNTRYLDLFDYPPALVHVGAPVADLIRCNAMRGECGPGEVEDHVEKRLGHMRRGLVHSFERVRADGQVLKTVGGPMPGGGYVMCFTDITAEAQAREELERAREELEMRVEARTVELSRANAALALATRDKTRFLAAASHDLLQPLHAARLFSAALARRLDSGAQPLLERVDRSIDAADALLRTLLDISRLDAGGITPRPERLELRALLADLVEGFAPLAAEKSLSLRLGAGSAIVECDPTLLRSIIQNFVSNAIRYTQRGGVLIGMRRRGAMVRIDVIDTGPGIALDQQQIIFREFERLDTNQEAGIGLGLAIVERTARLLGLVVEVSSIPGRGSRFSLTLPRVSGVLVAPREIKPRTRVTPPPTAAPILIVDDDAENCAAMRAYVESRGHVAQTAASATEALALPGRFAVGLIDFNLGAGQDGLALIAALRRAGRAQRFALVTAERSPELAARAAAAGVDLLAKPVAAETLDTWLAADG